MLRIIAVVWCVVLAAHLLGRLALEAEGGEETGREPAPAGVRGPATQGAGTDNGPGAASSPAVPTSGPVPEGGLKLLRRIRPWREDKDIQESDKVLEIRQSPDGKRIAWSDWHGNVFTWGWEEPTVTILNRTAIPEDIPGLGFGMTPTGLAFLSDTEIAWFPRHISPPGAWRAATVPKPTPKTPPRLARLTGKPIVWKAAILDEVAVVCTTKPFRIRQFHLRKYSLTNGQYLAACEIYPMPTGADGGYPHHVDVMAVSPDGSHLAIASACNSGLVDLSSFRLVKTYDLTLVKSLAFSPSGKLLALGRREELFVYETDTGRRVLHLLRPRHTPDPLVFTSERYLWFSEAGLFRLDIEAGQVKEVVPWGEAPNATAGLLSADGRHMYFGTRGGEIYVYELIP